MARQSPRAELVSTMLGIRALAQELTKPASMSPFRYMSPERAPDLRKLSENTAIYKGFWTS